MSLQRKFYLEPRKPRGIYYYIVRDPVSRKTLTYKSTRTTDLKQAEAIGMEWWTNGIEGRPKTSIDRKTLFCDYLVQFWDFDTSMYFRELETMGKEPQPEHSYETQRLIERYYRPYFKSALLCQVDGETLQQFIVYLRIERGLSSSTVNSARNAAFVALRYAKRKKLINFFDFDAVLRAGGKSKVRGILEKDELDKLLYIKFEKNVSRIAVLIGLHTGMRLGEIRALRVCDIHENKISVFQSYSKKNRFKCTKTREKREIPIIPWLYNEIMAYIKEMKLYKLDSLLLPGKNPERPLDSVQIRKDFYAVLSMIGINEKTRKERGISFHSTRHCLAHSLLLKGTKRNIAKMILGIKTDKIFDRYSVDHIVDKETFDQMAKAIEKVNQKSTPREPILFKAVI
jgi:integrase